MTMTRPRRWSLTLSLMALALIAATAIDARLVRWVAGRASRPHENDMLRLVRVAGYVPAWLAIAAFFALIDLRTRVRDFWTRGLLIVLSVLLAGLMAEAVKLLVRRERPHLGSDPGPLYVFRPFLVDPLSTSGLGMPSSHAAVAFGGAFMLARVAPGSWPVAVLWAAGCAASRVYAGAHFASDAVGSAIVGYAVASWLWSTHLRLSRRHGALPSA